MCAAPVIQRACTSGSMKPASTSILSRNGWFSVYHEVQGYARRSEAQGERAGRRDLGSPGSDDGPGADVEMSIKRAIGEVGSSSKREGQQPV